MSGPLTPFPPVQSKRSILFPNALLVMGTTEWSTLGLALLDARAYLRLHYSSIHQEESKKGRAPGPCPIGFPSSLGDPLNKLRESPYPHVMWLKCWVLATSARARLERQPVVCSVVRPKRGY